MNSAALGGPPRSRAPLPRPRDRRGLRGRQLERHALSRSRLSRESCARPPCAEGPALRSMSCDLATNLGLMSLMSLIHFASG